MNTRPHSSGYALEKVYVTEQEYRLSSDTEFSEPAAESVERSVEFGWDWRPISKRRFEVVVEIKIEPAREAPEAMLVRLIGVFQAHDGPLSIALPDFLRTNAPAILFPFAREVISTMSGRGPYGAFHLDPLNVQSIAANFDLAHTAGTEFLNDNPDIAENFALDYRAAPTLPAAAT